MRIVCHDTCTRLLSLFHTCAMTLWYLCHDPSYLRHDPSTYAPWLMHMCAMTNLYMCHDPFIRAMNSWRDTCSCVTGLIYMCDMTHSYVRHDSFTCTTWLIHMCDMAQYIHVPWPIHRCDEFVARRMLMHYMSDLCLLLRTVYKWIGRFHRSLVMIADVLHVWFMCAFIGPLQKWVGLFHKSLFIIQ